MGLKQGSILVIISESDKESRQRLVEAIRPVSSEITEVSTGQETLRYLTDRYYDCLILDYVLPDFDGLSLVKEIRLRGITVPIVVVTTGGDEMLAVQILHSGAQDYIPKDKITDDLLQKAVLNAIRLKESVDEAEYYKDFYDAAPVGFYTTDLKTGKFLKANAFCVEMLGCHSLAELRSKYKSTDFYPKSRRRELLRLLSVHGYVTDFEVKLKLPNNEVRWAIITARSCRHGDCLEGSVTDITERKKLLSELDELRKSQTEELRSIRDQIYTRLECA